MSKMDSWFRKHDPRSKNVQAKAQAKKYGFVMSERGFVDVVLRPRPEDVEKKLAEAEALVGMPHEKAKPLFDAILAKYDHQFIGYLSSKGEVLNADGVVIEEHVRPGDSIASGPSFIPPVCLRDEKSSGFIGNCDSCQSVFSTGDPKVRSVPKGKKFEGASIFSTLKDLKEAAGKAGWECLEKLTCPSCVARRRAA